MCHLEGSSDLVLGPEHVEMHVEGSLPIPVGAERVERPYDHPKAGWKLVGYRESAMSVSTQPSGYLNTFEGQMKPLYMNSMWVQSLCRTSPHPLIAYP